MNLVQKIALLYLIAMAFMGWGIAVGKYEVFPFQIISDVKAFVEGHALGTDTTVVDKFMNDLGIEPRRYVHTYPPNAVERTKALDIPQLKLRRENPLVYIAPGHRSGYRVIFGALDFEDTFWGGVLLDSMGNTLHTWHLSTSHLATNMTDDELKNLYGVHLFPDGSVIFTQQERSGGIVKVDACGEILWNLEGIFHHTISATEDGYFWTFVGRQEDFDHKLAKVSVSTGEINTVIDMSEVRKVNSFVHVFNLQKDREIEDISHGNDISPLPKALSDNFKDFKAGDLLISYRTQNLVFVLDPDSLKVKWWRIGPWDRQHDPDWEADGLITVFSNNKASDRKYSDIVAIDPDSFEFRIILDGEAFNFYSGVNGDHEISEYGTRMITSTSQGWAFEVDQESKIVFSFVNNYSREDNKSLNLSEAYRLPKSYFTEEFWKRCTD